MYLPSIVVVLLSCVSFWIDHESVTARVVIGIITVLMTVSQISGQYHSSLAGPFTKAIDVWMVSCLVFVLGAFVEYAVVHVLARRDKSLCAQGAIAPACIEVSRMFTTAFQNGERENFKGLPIKLGMFQSWSYLQIIGDCLNFYEILLLRIITLKFISTCLCDNMLLEIQ